MVKLIDIAKEINFEKGRNDKNGIPRILHFLIMGYKDLWYDVSGLPNFKILEVDSNLSVDIPSDMIKHIMIGVVDSNGEIQTLRENKRIAGNIDTTNCGTPTQPPVQALRNQPDYGGYYWSYSGVHTRTGEVIGRFYGLGGENTNGDYRIDEKAGKIYFSYTSKIRQVVIVYMGDIEKASGQFEIHPWLRQPLKAYYKMAMLEAKDDPPLGQLQMRQMKYAQEKRKAKKRFQSQSIAKIIDIAKKNFSQSPKF